MIRAYFLAALLVAIAGLAAGQQTVGDLTVIQPWARATAPNAQSGVVYLTVANKGTGADPADRRFDRRGGDGGASRIDDRGGRGHDDGGHGRRYRYPAGSDRHAKARRRTCHADGSSNVH